MRLPTETVIEKYKQNLYAAAFSVCRSPEDSEDAVQDAFIKYHTSVKEFETEEHLRAWLIRITVNRAKDIASSYRRRNSVPLEEYTASVPFETREESELFTAVMSIREKYRTVIHLFYYEDYTVAEIADILHLTQSNVKVRLNRGRALLSEEEKARISIAYSPSEQIRKYERRSFNVGYLFLQQIYYDLGLHKICIAIKRKHSAINACLPFAQPF